MEGGPFLLSEQWRIWLRANHLAGSSAGSCPGLILLRNTFIIAKNPAYQRYFLSLTNPARAKPASKGGHTRGQPR